MNIERLGPAEIERAGGVDAVAAELHARVPAGDDVATVVGEIVADVRARGDAAVAEYSQRFDGGDRARRQPAVSTHELDEALGGLSAPVHAGLQMAITNVALVAAAGVHDDVSVSLPQGHQVILREVPVASAAVYVPGGRAPYPSTVVMGTVTARAAGVLDVAICAPPAADGRIDPTILAACRLCGVSRVYCMGGAQAIAALAYGTETVAPVDVIVGPGNLYVQEAKRQLSGVVGIDGFAGPSDLMVIFDDDAEVELVALDLLAQAEHGAGSLVCAVSWSAAALDALARRLSVLAADGPAVPNAGPCVLLCAEDPRAGLRLANAYGPEHLQLIGSQAESLAPLVQSAGCLFVGAASATAFGDYVAGSNHVLPTGGAARFASGLSVAHFRRRMSEVRIGTEAAAALSAPGSAVARSEGFAWHAASMEARGPSAASASAGESVPA